MEAIDVLLRHDAGENFVAVDVAGQRQLNENAVDLRIRVEIINQGFEL